MVILLILLVDGKDKLIMIGFDQFCMSILGHLSNIFEDNNMQYKTIIKFLSP